MIDLVRKRDGSTENFDAEKINKVLEWACENIDGVSPSDVAMNAKLSITNKIRTKDIHEVLIQSAYNLISEDTPNYQFVAARLRIYALRKEVWGGSLPPRLLDHIKRNKKIYDDTLLELYSESEIHKIDKFLNHDRDFKFTHAGIQQMVEKYLISDRSTKKVFETPQFAFILIPMILLAKNPNKMKLIKEAYDHISKFKINLPTPILAGVRSRTKFYSSCVLIDCGDSLDSIFTSAMVAGKYTARRSGIGINMGRIRAVGASIRDSEVISTGIIPFIRLIESSVKSTSQNGLRGGGATVSVPWWHYEIEDVIVLKNNRGTEDNRVRKLDYAIQIDNLLIERAKNDEEITLMCPKESGIYQYWGTEEFAQRYKDAEGDNLRLVKKIKARELLLAIAKERLETGRIYLMFMDNCRNCSWVEPVTMTNLCCLSGDTNVDVIINSSLMKVSIAELNENFSSYDDVKIASNNGSSVIFDKVVAVAKTRENSKVIRITDSDSGATLVCTSDHKIFTKNRGYVEAKDLKSNDKLEII